MMKNFLVFLGLILFTVIGCEENQEMMHDRLLFGVQYTQPDSDKPLNGEKVFYYDSGEVRTKAIFANGYPKEVTHFYRNGLKWSRVTYEKRQMKTMTTWYKNGQKRFETIDNGSQRWFKSGQKKMEFMGNIILTWYENGQLKAKAYYANDGRTLHGITKVWYKNGTLKGKENYIHGKLDGERIKWDADGNTVLSQVYDEGVLVESRKIKV